MAVVAGDKETHMAKGAAMERVEKQKAGYEDGMAKGTGVVAQKVVAV